MPKREEPHPRARIALRRSRAIQRGAVGAISARGILLPHGVKRQIARGAVRDLRHRLSEERGVRVPAHKFGVFFGGIGKLEAAQIRIRRKVARGVCAAVEFVSHLVLRNFIARHDGDGSVDRINESASSSVGR